MNEKLNEIAKGSFLRVNEQGKAYWGQSEGGGAADDVYLIKHITNWDKDPDAGAEEWQGDYAGAIAAFDSGKSLKFVEAEVIDGKEWVNFESFDYYYNTLNSFFRFVGYYNDNFVTYKLTESGVTGGNIETHIASLYVDIPKSFFLKSASGKQFRVIVSNAGQLSTEEVT